MSSRDWKEGPTYSFVPMQLDIGDVRKMCADYLTLVNYGGRSEAMETQLIELEQNLASVAPQLLAMLEAQHEA